MAAVVVEGLTKRYGNLDAVSDVSFEVDQGEVFALLGPNGAGKTSTIEILEGFRSRDRGRVEVLGCDPADPATSRQLRESLGVVLQELAVEPFLSVRQVLSRNAGFYPRPRSVDEVLCLVGLEEKADVRVKKLSGGQQRRLDLALGIVGNPELLFLDEPTTGFDPSARRDAWQIVRALTGGGTTVILTTHYMDEAEALASRVAIISGGKIVAEGAPDTLGGRDVSEARISFRLPVGVSESELPVQATGHAGDAIEIRTGHEIEVLSKLTNWALENKVSVAGLSVERLTLEDVYLRLTGHASDHDTGNAVASGS
ncbi:MAG: ABC transporter ATP-binding protein [Acidimicrobiales bacterium]